jgi:hypothetical protein
MGTRANLAKSTFKNIDHKEVGHKQMDQVFSKERYSPRVPTFSEQLQ